MIKKIKGYQGRTLLHFACIVVFPKSMVSLLLIEALFCLHVFTAHCRIRCTSHMYTGSNLKVLQKIFWKFLCMCGWCVAGSLSPPPKESLGSRLWHNYSPRMLVWQKYFTKSKTKLKVLNKFCILPRLFS